MALSAAELQKQLEGAPDPFPSLGESSSKPSASQSASEPLNTESETLFPSLAPSSASKAAPSNWTTASTRRVVKPVSAPVFTESFVLTGIDASANHTKDGKPKTLADIVKDVQTKFKVKVEVSSQRTSNQTTFTVVGALENSVDAARRALTTSLSPVISLVVQTPASVIGTIVGTKGANLKHIRDYTSTKIDIPRKETLTANGQGVSHPGTRSPSPLPISPAEEKETLVPITITGPSSMAHEAQAMIQAIIAEKTSRSVQKIKVTPSYVYPFVLLRRADFLKVAGEADISLMRDDKEKEITVSGDREAVGRVIESIRSCATFYESDLTSVKISLPKRQHRLLTGAAADQILQNSKCNVVIPENDPSEEVTVWGKAANLGLGLQAVMERATSQHTHSVPLPRPNPHHALTHLHKSGYIKSFNSSHPDVAVYFPPLSTTGLVSVDFVGEKAAVEKAQKELTAFMGLLNGATRNIQIDHLIHKLLNAKSGKQLKGYHTSKNTLVYFPPEAEANSNVALVYDPLAAQAVKTLKEKQAILAEIEGEILALVATLGQIKTETISVEKKWHSVVTGRNNSTLNALIGEDRALSIQVGGTGHEDIVVIRGSPTEVDRATKDILRLVEEAKNDAIDSGHVVEFQISQQYVARIVGSAGAGIQKYREQLDVKVDIEDLRDTTEHVVTKKKKTTTSAQSLVKITGRKQNAEEAKKRILAQVDKMADETLEILKIPRQYHSSIIGQQGKYIQRLQEKYGVKINMGKEDSASPDEVQIRGGKKGVSQAKSEIQELVEYEKENNHQITVNVSSRAVPRILGSKGAKIHEIMADTGAHIDVNDGNKDKDKTRDKDETAAIIIKGTKKAVAAAKTAVMAIANAVDDETTVTVKIEPKFHRTIIGGGGVGLRNLLARVGAPSDSKEQAGLVRFPQGGDEVIIRGEKTLVKKIQVELERVVSTLRERIVLGVVIPVQHHRMLIGHGGQHLTELEKRTGAEVQFPGSRSYNQVASPENATTLGDADPKSIVKVVGPQAACDKAIAELLESVEKATNREKKEQNRAQTTSDLVSKVQIPFKHYHLLRPTGNLVRELRSAGVNFVQSGKPKHEGVGLASRIDDEVEVDSHGVEWKLLEYGAAVEEGETELTLKARDAGGLEAAEKIVKDALQKADEISHIGYMTFPDRGPFPRIIGNKGSVINDLSLETGSEIIVPKDDTTIKIYGMEGAVNLARAAITRVAFGNRGRRNED